MRDPIAVVGLACRFPGAADEAALWELLSEGRDATGPTPPDRYDVDALYSPTPAPGKVVSRSAGYLDGIDLFDPDFFGMTGEQADDLDPQQRLLMMLVHEALENAGLPPASLAGSRTGVYVGALRADYLDLMNRRGLDAISPSAIYNYRANLSGRLSYEYDLRGPSMTVDTACSSSLLAVHLACQAIRSGEIRSAVVAGVNLKLTADEDVMFSQVGVLAKDGHCKFGDASADGFAPSDGAGVVVLRPLSDALAAGDRVRAVIRGSAVSNDGASNPSFLAPSVEGHAQMLRWAYEDAGVDPARVDFVEAHGTGNQLIDRVEFAALGEVLGAGRPADRPLLVGAVKTNLGHSEAASGMAALIKTVLCLEHRELPPNLHFTTPNPTIPWSDLPVEIPTELVKLPAGPLTAGVSGQGVSAVNVHLVVGEHPSIRDRAAATGPYLLALSAKTPAALLDLVRAYLRHLKGPVDLRDVCWTAGVRRQHHEHRLAVQADDAAGLRAALAAHLAGTPAEPPAAAADYLAGGPAPFTAEGAAYTPVPTYPWQLTRHWLA